VTERVIHQLDNAMALSFASNYFDSARSERVLQHLVNPQQALSEMIRVTRPGGWIVVLDTDWSTASTDTDEVDIERRLLNFHIDHGFASALVGRQLFRFFRQQRLADIQVEMAPTYLTNYAIARKGAMLDEAEQSALKAGIVTQAEVDRFHRSLEKADREGTYFFSINQVLIAGRKPE
jgi:ubiquinone/menaquinone biosynthesis C-methylase UbiE